MAYNYLYNKQADSDALLSLISIDLGITPLFLDYDLKTFDITIFFENQLTPQEETDLNAIISNYVYVDLGNYASFNSVYTSEFSATTINSGSTNLYGIFSTIANSGETNTVSNIGSGFGLFKQKSGVDFQFRTLSAGTNVVFLTGDTITLNATNDITRIQPGSNITTGGTANNPNINVVSSPSFSSITASGASSFTTLSATTLVSGSTNLYNIFAQPGRVVNNINAGSNIITGGTANSPNINVVSSPSFNSITASGASSFTTLSATTLVSGSTNLYSIFSTTDTNDITRVQPGSNITTGGTANNPNINVVSSPSFSSITASGTSSFTTLSATTLVSGSTNLYSIFSTTDTNDITRVQPGSNITTGGTSNNPNINVVSSPSFNSITASGASSFTTLSATTLVSGSTNLYNIFQTIGGGSSTQTSVQPGANIITGGTAISPIISLTTSPSINNLNISGLTTSSGSAIFLNLSADSLTLDVINTPTTPLSAATLFTRNKANRMMIGQIGPSGIDYTFQPSLYGNKIAFWNPPGNSTTVPGVLGMAALTANGTVTARNVATTNLFTRTKRLAVVSANAAGSLAGYRLGVAQYTLGNGSGAGGFMYVIRFGVADAKTATRMFIGLRNTTASPTNVEPSTITNCIGVGNGAADTNLRIFYGGSAAQASINLGANFPCNTNSLDLYEFTLFASPNSNNTVGYKVERLNTGDVASGILTGVAGTALPLNTTLLTLNDFRTNNATTGAVALDYVSIYIETDY